MPLHNINIKKLKALLPMVLVLLLFASCSGNTEEKKAAHLEKGNEYMSSEKYREALIEFKNVIQLDPASGRGHYNLALAHLKLATLSDLQIAFAELTRTVEIDPAHAEAHLKLGDLYLLSRDYDKAGEKADLLLGLDPDNMDAKVLLANSLAGKGNLKESIEVIEKVLAASPDSIVPYMAAAGIHLAGRDPASAERVYNAAIKKLPDAAEPKVALAQLYIRTGKAGKAETVLKEAVAAAPDNQDLLIVLAYFYDSSRRL
jgi:tetratricopeptide (TPR) repeat protein